VTFTYNIADLSSDVAKLRLMIPDNDASVYNFEDEELVVLVALEGNNLKRATALGLETIAANEVMVLKVIKALDITTDGAKVSDALLRRADKLRQQADDDEAAEDAGFDVAEMVVDDFTYRERMVKEMLRGGS
jgi:hypothetical protein